MVAQFAAAQFQGGSAIAASVRATMKVDVQVSDNCVALLNSSTTSLAATSACRNSTVATVLSPMVSSTSLSTLAPAVLMSSGTGIAAAGPAAPAAGGATTAETATTGTATTGTAATGKGAVTQQFNSLDGSLTGGSAASQFIVSAADLDGQVIMVTY